MAREVMDRLIAILNPQRFKEKDKYLDAILAEYKSKKETYDDFRNAAHKTLESLLNESGYKYQIVSRTKTPASLRDKLVRKKEHGVHYHSVLDVEDIVGVRIIFYSENDKQGFVKKMKREFDGVMEIKEKEKSSGYRATHIIMSLGEKRTRLSEYKNFKGLKSEVQITSILHHAWAEIEHDLIYKDLSGLKHRNPKKYETIKQKMGELLEKYINKAAEELDEIVSNGDNLN